MNQNISFQYIFRFQNICWARVAYKYTYTETDIPVRLKVFDRKQNSTLSLNDQVAYVI